MAAPTTITVSYGSSSTVTIPIPAALQTLDSGQDVSTQSGFKAFDVLMAAITKRGGIHFTDASNVLTFIPIGQITKITAA
jgi:hypothetical protein